MGESGTLLDTPMWSITTVCEDPDVIARYVDYVYSDDGILLANYGVEGETFTYVDGVPRLTDMVLNNPDYSYGAAMNIFVCDRMTPAPFIIDEEGNEVPNYIMNGSNYVIGERLDLRKSGDDTEPTYGNTASSYGRNWYIEGSLSYNRSFGAHTVTALALYNQSKEYYIQGDYPDIARTYVGFVGRVTYDWNNRYMAEVNFGYNGSENFAPGRRFGSFPAGSVGWLISDEPFFKPLKGVVSFLKLRASCPGTTCRSCRSSKTADCWARCRSTT